jgi:hypothetical protein
MKAAAEAAKQFADRVREFTSTMRERVVGQLEDFANAFAVAGPVGVAAELLTRSKQFQQIQGQLSTIIQTLADSLGAMLEPLMPLLGAVQAVASAIGDALAPVFRLLYAVVEPFIPPLMALAGLFQALAPIVSTVAAVAGVIARVLATPLTLSLRVLFEALKGAAWVITKVAQMLAPLWNGIVEAISAVLRAIGGIDVFGTKPLAFLNDWAAGVDAARVDTDALAASLAALEGLTWESAMAKAAEIAATAKTTDSLREMNEQLTNMPTWYRTQLARFNATEGVTGAIGGGGKPTPTGGGTVVSGDVHIHVEKVADIEDLDRLNEHIERARERRLSGGFIRSGQRF